MNNFDELLEVIRMKKFEPPIPSKTIVLQSASHGIRHDSLYASSNLPHQFPQVHKEDTRKNNTNNVNKL